MFEIAFFRLFRSLDWKNQIEGFNWSLRVLVNNMEYKIDRYKLYCSATILAEKNIYILHSHKTRTTLLGGLCFPTTPPLPHFVRGCLHDTGAKVRVHSGSLSWLYIYLHDTTTNFMLARVTPARVHPGSCTGARISLRYEISQRYHVNTKRPPVSV